MRRCGHCPNAAAAYQTRAGCWLPRSDWGTSVPAYLCEQICPAVGMLNAGNVTGYETLDVYLPQLDVDVDKWATSVFDIHTWTAVVSLLSHEDTSMISATVCMLSQISRWPRCAASMVESEVVLSMLVTLLSFTEVDILRNVCVTLGNTAPYLNENTNRYIFLPLVRCQATRTARWDGQLCMPCPRWPNRGSFCRSWARAWLDARCLGSLGCCARTPAS
ncbi:hypothetical protein B0H10DRAFT_131501 [Mycena sp. CBHHK59/15]|nr:hypothetical protein B0H10DRAFT_131501 [Mycena sp. CBHHK59/15]